MTMKEEEEKKMIGLRSKRKDKQNKMKSKIRDEYERSEKKIS